MPKTSSHFLLESSYSSNAGLAFYGDDDSPNMDFMSFPYFGLFDEISSEISSSSPLLSSFSFFKNSSAFTAFVFESISLNSCNQKFWYALLLCPFYSCSVYFLRSSCFFFSIASLYAWSFALRKAISSSFFFFSASSYFGFSFTSSYIGFGLNIPPTFTSSSKSKSPRPFFGSWWNISLYWFLISSSSCYLMFPENYEGCLIDGSSSEGSVSFFYFYSSC